MARLILGCTLALTALATQNGLTGQAREQALEQAWGQELAGPSPIKRVVSLLTKMRDELVAEADKEAEMYDQMVCWCETNEKEKVKAIAEGEAKDKDLQAEIEARSARFGSVTTEIEAMKKQIAEDGVALKQATAIRENEAAAFREEESDLVTQM